MKKLLFTKENLVKSILAIKTETRRLGSFSSAPSHIKLVGAHKDGKYKPEFGGTVQDMLGNRYKPKYIVGDKVYLAEPYKPTGKTVKYMFDLPETHENYKKPNFWKNKLFQKEVDARFYAVITNVYAQRLQSITKQSIREEGVIDPVQGMEHEAWKQLWDSINGKKCPYDSNPFVWCYEYYILKGKGFKASKNKVLKNSDFSSSVSKVPF